MAVTSGQNAPFTFGFGLQDGQKLDNNLANPKYSWASGLVAVGTTQANALQLTARLNTLATSSASTGVVLPDADAGKEVIVNVRAAGVTVQVYGKGTDTIDGTAGSTGVALAVARGAALFVCTSPGAWASFVLGATST